MFIEEYEGIPESDPRGRISCVYRWLRADWRGLYAELRERRPVFVNPAFAMVTRHVDVLSVLSQPGLFSVRPYASKMDPSVGPFMLARDETVLNWHDKSVLRAAMRWEDLAGVRELAGREARAALDSSAAPVNLVSTVGRLVPIRVVQKYFGFAGPDEATLLRWSKATQTDMFRNPTNIPAAHEANVAAGTEMRAWLADAIADGCIDPGSIFGRLLASLDTASPPLSTEGIISNMAGLLVGAVETTSQAIVQATEQILLRPDVREAAEAAARSADLAAFDAIVWEALRFNPITTLQFRFAEHPVVLGAGQPYQAAIPRGTIVAACTGSAMFDEDVVPEPDAFRPGRLNDRQFHLGFGHHECLGRHVGLEMVPEAIRQILLTPGLSLIDGPDGKIDFAGGPFPERFMVQRSDPASNGPGAPELEATA